MDEDAINARIGGQVRALRRERGLSLAALAAACGVSRSALSLIERAASSPTAVVLNRIAGGLGVPLEALLGQAAAARSGTLARRDDQAVWRDPSSGYLRRSVSPASGGTIRIVEVTFPPGARVVFDNGGRWSAVEQQLWLLEGTLEYAVGEESYRLQAGDCVSGRLDRPTAFSNPTAEPARYAVVTAESPPREQR